MQLRIMKPDLNKQSDAELLARFAAGQESAFREIVTRYKNGLYAFLRRFLSQRELTKELGLTEMKSISVQGEFVVSQDHGVEPDYELLADSTPFLKELVAKKQAARYNLRSSKGSFFPEIYLSG